VSGVAGPPGPPGPSGSGGGFGAAQLQALFQPGPKGPAAAAAASDQPYEVPKELRDHETLKTFVEISDVVRQNYLKIGTKENPAKTCKDIALSDPEAKDGMYYLDPNGGHKHDAIEAYCNMKKQETCIYAKPDKVYRGTYSAKRHAQGAGHKWFSTDLRDGRAFTYKADSSQMRNLQLQSSQGTQTITYHCKNSIAVFDQSTNSYDQALMLLGGEYDVEFTHNGKHGKSYEVDPRYDGCKRSTMYNRWSKTKVTVSTSRPERLPIYDIAPYDTGRIQFGLEIGPVCFS
jgi:collagen type II alpha